MLAKSTRENRMAGLLGGLLLVAAILPASPGMAETARVASPPEEETLVYDISFLIFRNAAVGSLRMRFLPDRGLYEGVVTAQTKGFVRIVSLSRQDRYRSLMRLTPDGRLIPVEFHKEVKMGRYRANSTTVLDYEAGVMRWTSTEVKGGKTKVETKTHPIPPGTVYEDFISAFFNLRRGVYGPIRAGKKVKVLSLPTQKWFKERKRKLGHFTVKIAEPKVKKGDLSHLMVSITVPKELFGQKVGAVRFHVSENYVPSRIIVKKAVLFGDMRGVLRSRRVAQNRLAAGPFWPQGSR